VIFAGIDVNIITHPKALIAGAEALGLWTWGMCYAQIHRTDGRLPRVAVMSALGEKPRVLRRLAVRLVTSGLWVELEDGSFQVHNYGSKNQTAAEIATRNEQRKLANAERQARWRNARNAKVTDPITRDVTEAVTRSNARTTTTTTTTTTPVKESLGTAPPPASPTKRGTRLPDGWSPSAQTQAWAREQGVAEPTGALLAEFADYWRSVPGARGVKLDWDATFRNRVRQVAQRAAAAPSSRRGAEITRQGFDPDAPWMTLPEVG